MQVPSSTFEFLNSELASKRNSELVTCITIHLLYYYSSNLAFYGEANSMCLTEKAQKENHFTYLCFINIFFNKTINGLFKKKKSMQ